MREARQGLWREVSQSPLQVAALVAVALWAGRRLGPVRLGAVVWRAGWLWVLGRARACGFIRTGAGRDSSGR